MKIDDLTPIEEYDGILFKRDDLYRPFKDSLLDGGKTRQMQKLMLSLKTDKEVKGLITTSSVHSPQSVIVAKICSVENIPCIVIVGGATDNVASSIKRHKTLSIAQELGAEIRIVSKLGYDSVLMPFAEYTSNINGFDIIKFGINLIQFPEAIIDAIANQVANIPDELDNLIVPCGSGLTCAGIMVGLHRFKKNVKNIVIIQISGYDRTKVINDILQMFDVNLNYNFIIDFTYNYTDKVKANITDDFELSYIYEAKAYQFYQKRKSILDINDSDRTMFWVIGQNNFLYK